MYKHLFILILLAIRITYTDVLIDDFEKGESKNLVNGDWYYFSDVKDGGNSVIINAEMLSQASYSPLKPVKLENDSGYCAKLEYVLGDTSPVITPDEDNTGYCNFVALGTDIARQGSVTDIQPAYGVSFKARSRDPIVLFFELVTSNIYDYAYYRAYFYINSEWQTFRVDFNDTNQFMIPLNTGSYDIEDHPLMLSKVQKMNWQVASCFDCISVSRFLGENNEDYCHCHSDSGYLFLDDIILLDSSKTDISHIALRPTTNRTAKSEIISDLLGRHLSSSRLFRRVSGVYVMPEKKFLNIHSNITVPNK